MYTNIRLNFGFQTHRAVGQIMAEVIRQLSDSLLIPFDVVNYANHLKLLVNGLDNAYGKLLRDNGVEFGKNSFSNYRNR